MTRILVVLVAILVAGNACADTNFLAAADFSLLPFFEARGIKYRDSGQIQDAFTILKNHGINCIRLRLFTSSATQAANDPYNYTNNLAYNLPLALRVKNAGLQFSLDFHYSDTWADPGHQATPAAWSNLTFAQLVTQMRTYNSNTIAAFAAEGATPDYVQIGNEITGGLLWPSGKVPGTNSAVQWSQLGQLMKAAIQGVHDAAGANMPKIIVHIDRGGSWSGTQYFFDNLTNQGVPFDIIGESYYPFYHGDLTNLSQCLTNAANRYGKPIVVAETAFPWTNTYFTTNIYGLAPGANGQIAFMFALAQILRSVPNHLCVGAYYWGAEYQAASGVNEAGFNTASLFDSHGNLLPGADAFAGIGAPLNVTASRSGTNLTLRWPLSGAASKLVTTTNLATPVIWAPVNNTVQTTSTVFSLTLPLTNTHFYRLQ